MQRGVKRSLCNVDDIARDLSPTVARSRSRRDLIDRSGRHDVERAWSLKLCTSIGSLSNAIVSYWRLRDTGRRRHVNDLACGSSIQLNGWICKPLIGLALGTGSQDWIRTMKSVELTQPAAQSVPTGENLAHHSSTFVSSWLARRNQPSGFGLRPRLNLVDSFRAHVR
jgi:hypothetical protein